MIRREPTLVIVLVMVVVAGVVAALLGRTVWAAVCGSAIVVAMWAIEWLAARHGSQGSFGQGMAVGLGGMLARVALALTSLALLGIFAPRDAFVDATLAFVASYTIYNLARLWRHPAVPPAAGRGHRTGGT